MDLNNTKGKQKSWKEKIAKKGKKRNEKGQKQSKTKKENKDRKKVYRNKSDKIGRGNKKQYGKTIKKWEEKRGICLDI